MINKDYIYDKVLPLIKDKCRMIDYYLIQNIFEDKQKEIVDELRKYQNEDKGLGNALEPDTRMPFSSNLATSSGINILDAVKDENIKKDLVKELVEYLEESYNKEDDRFYMVTKDVNDYPRAVWWNFKDLKKNFPYGNPDPEIVGFLYKYRKYVKNLNLNAMINRVIEYILSDKFMNDGFHSLMSGLRFYNRIDDDVKNLIHDRMHEVVNKNIDESLGKWDEYALEPYKIYVINHHFTEVYPKELKLNLEMLLQDVEELNIMPKWKWYQFDDVFEEIKYDWVGHIYYEYIKALRLHREI